jgi:cytochrome c oxidase subunit I
MSEPEARERARRITVRYLVASTLILLASGLLGELIRSSQAGWGRLPDNTWYALMTAHGLGAFVGWAGFAVMGLSWWVLSEVGFPLRRFGLAMASLAWWLMVLGVAGVLVTTLLMHFAGSWVFLYPLPFHGAGEWGDWATALFAGSVLLAGLSIVVWCAGILQTIVSPALHAVPEAGLWNRTGIALGFGYLWPKRFATNPRSVPYAVIPLTVIAIDMIIATLPLAALLVEMIVQSFADVSVDPLLAKNVLWWFGHPVVYLLLFPAVAVYYLLIPRMAGRDLVAGNVIAVAWTIAVIANVFVWAHHIYLDYPSGTHQGAINTLMQPITFSLTIPSALSLYSLGFTIYRAPAWRWTGASTALFLGLVSWLLAGLSGVVNATIAFDVVVHNTLWIVGHFHHMALLNIGLLIFGALYALIPDLTGKQLWSDTLAKWHVWLTFLFGMANSAVWMVQGLEGAPRRFSVLPHHYLTLTQVGAVFAFGIGAAQLLFVVNMWQTLRGAAPSRRRTSDAALEGGLILVVLALLVAVGVVAYELGRRTAPKSSPAPAVAQPIPGVAGKKVFASAACGSCHTLADAGASGTVGPNLDEAKPSRALVVARVSDGKGGMPSFGDRLTAQQIADVADYVSSAAGQ